MTDRNKAINDLIYSPDEQTFLDRLERLYSDLGLDAGLQFDAVQRYWRREAPLPQNWRSALAEKAWLAANDEEVASSQHLATATFHGWAAAHISEEMQLDFGERLVVLLSPFLDPSLLVRWLLPLVVQTNARAVCRDDSRRWVAAQMSAMRSWAQELAEGKGDWQQVQHWYIAAGARPQALSELLVPTDKIYWQGRHITALVAMRTLLLLVREQLQRAQVPDETWTALLLRCASFASSHDWENLQLYRNQWPMLQQNLGLPLLQVLLRREELQGLQEASESYRSTFNVLFHDMGLAFLLAESTDDFRALLQLLPLGGLNGLSLPHGFVARFPQAALDFEQVRYARSGAFHAELDTPEALQWYRKILLTEPRESQPFISCFQCLARHVSDIELDSLIRTYYFDDADSSFPCALGFMRDTALLRSYLNASCRDLSRWAALRLVDLASIKREGYSYRAPVPGDCTIDPQGWAELLAASSSHPDLFAEHTLCQWDLVRGADRLDRWQLLWDRVSAPGYRQLILARCCYGLEYTAIRPALQAFLAGCYEQEPQLLEECLAERRIEDIEGLQGCPESLWPLLVVLAARCMESEPAARRGNIRRLQKLKLANAIAANPKTYAALSSKQQGLLLPLFDSAALLACADTLGKVLAGNSKAVHEPAVALIAGCSADIIQRSGLLPGSAQGRQHLLKGIALSRDPLMAPLIAQYFHDPAHDEQSRDLSLDALDKASYPLQGLDPWAGLDLAGLQCEAQKQSGSLAEGIWNDAYAMVLEPLGEQLGRFLLTLMQRADRLPRRARQILAHLSLAQRSDFALLGVEHWIAENGANEYLWLLQAMKEYGDERAAHGLVKAIKDWKKTRTQKSALAIAQLCELPGDYGCFQARELWENGKLTVSIRASANAALAAAAERRGLSLETFLEALAPDFGMGRQGLLLDVGSYSYNVRIRSDLSLVVFDPSGKASKTLPKAQASEDKAMRELAESQFKALAKNLKPMLKQQALRLLRALQLGHSWSADSWVRLFVEHPLLNIIAQNVVWSALDEDEMPLKRFRPDASGGLLDLDDEAYRLPERCTVHVAHPLELDGAERAAWGAHFADYELVSPIDQWNTPVQQASGEEQQAGLALRVRGKVLSRGKLGSLLERWGYLKGAAEDGGVFSQHTWSLDGDGWQVTLRHSAINAGYFDADDQVELEDLLVYQRIGDEMQVQCLSDLPAAFCNTVLVQAQSLVEAAA